MPKAIAEQAADKIAEALNNSKVTTAVSFINEQGYSDNVIANETARKARFTEGLAKLETAKTSKEVIDISNEAYGYNNKVNPNPGYPSKTPAPSYGNNF